MQMQHKHEQGFEKLIFSPFAAATSSVTQIYLFLPLHSFVCPSLVPVLDCMVSRTEAAHGLAYSSSTQG